jgi:hypothetical protein
MKTHIPSAHAILTHPTLAEGLGVLFSSEPSTVNIAAAVNVKVDEDKIDRIVSDVRDEAHPSCSPRNSR